MRRLVAPGRTPEAVYACAQALHYGMGELIEPLGKIIDEKLWLAAGHDSFASLVYTDVPEGWAATRELVLYPIRRYPQLTARVKESLPDADVKPFELGEITKPLKKNGEAGRGNSFDNIKATEEGGTKGGTSAEYLASRLARDNEELYEMTAR